MSRSTASAPGWSDEPRGALPPGRGNVAYDEDGVDRTLIREWLAKSPAERLDLSDACAQEIETLRARLRSGPVRT